MLGLLSLICMGFGFLWWMLEVIAMGKVLIGCEKSGVVRDAFLRHGHDLTAATFSPETARAIDTFKRMFVMF